MKKTPHYYPFVPLPEAEYMFFKKIFKYAYPEYKDEPTLYPTCDRLFLQNVIKTDAMCEVLVSRIGGLERLEQGTAGMDFDDGSDVKKALVTWEDPAAKRKKGQYRLCAKLSMAKVGTLRIAGFEAMYNRLWLFKIPHHEYAGLEDLKIEFDTLDGAPSSPKYSKYLCNILDFCKKEPESSICQLCLAWNKKRRKNKNMEITKKNKRPCTKILSNLMDYN